MNDEIIAEMDTKTLEGALKLVYQLTGIRMNATKKTLLQSRLRPRMKELKLGTYLAYVDYVSSHKEEWQNFINSVTTNETYFFRTQRIWDFVNNEFIPEWFKKNANRTLRIWSAAASTGEEAHSIAICCEEFKKKNPNFQYEVTTSDIDTQVLAVGQKGDYNLKSIDSFRKNYPKLFELYIKEKDGVYRTTDEVHKKIIFHQHDLFKKPSKSSHFDLVFLRNVLIYFEAADQEKVIQNISNAIVPNGLLIIGESESLNNLNTPFKFKVPLIYELK